MTWFKVDDKLAFHQKVIAAGNAAMGLWVRSGSWASATLSNGYVPRNMLTLLGAQRRDAEKLVAVGLWFHAERTQDAHETHTGPTQDQHSTDKCKGSPDHSACGKSDGYAFHDWGDHQPTKADVEAERASNRERQRAFRERKRNAVSNAVTNEGTNGASNDPPTRPDPTHLTEAKASVPRKRGKRIPDGFHITEEMRQWGIANCPNLDGQAETTKFINYWQAKAGRDAVKLDWEATWRNWMLTAKERQPTAKLNPTEKAQNIMQMGRELQEGLFHGPDGNQPALGEGGFGGQPAGDEGSHRGLGRVAAS